MPLDERSHNELDGRLRKLRQLLVKKDALDDAKAEIESIMDGYSPKEGASKHNKLIQPGWRNYREGVYTAWFPKPSRDASDYFERKAPAQALVTAFEKMVRHWNGGTRVSAGELLSALEDYLERRGSLDEQGEKEPSDRQELILETMLVHEITSRRRRQPRRQIVPHINRTHKPTAYARPFASLVTQGFLASQEGSGGGYWLTAKGKAAAERLRSDE